MREIEFRGKSTHTGEWHYGWLIYSKLNNAYEIAEKLEMKQYCNGVYFFVDPNTIGQYIGHKDKKGIKIFEGDILEGTAFNKLVRGVVKYGYDRFQIFGKYVVDLYNLHDFEVIGNIYDNPELLEVDNVKN